jgi:hypothetical protein
MDDMKTTEDVLTAGRYASKCCGHEQSFEAQAVFQRCPHCHNLCDWEMAEDSELIETTVARIA